MAAVPHLIFDRWRHSTSLLCPGRYPRVQPPFLQASRSNHIPRWEQGRHEGQYPLRNDQLVLRHDKMYEALAVMKKISLGDIKNLLPQQLATGLLEQWEGTFDPEELYLAGHSMGGAACVSDSARCHGSSFTILQVYVLSNSSSAGFDLLPIKKAVMFDVSVVRYPNFFSDS